MNTMLAMAFVVRVHAETDPSDLVCLQPNRPCNEHSSEGVVPTLEELEVIQSAGGVDETLLDSLAGNQSLKNKLCGIISRSFGTPIKMIGGAPDIVFSNGLYYRKYG